VISTVGIDVVVYHHYGKSKSKSNAY